MTALPYSMKSGNIPLKLSTACKPKINPIKGGLHILGAGMVGHRRGIRVFRPIRPGRHSSGGKKKGGLYIR